VTTAEPTELKRTLSLLVLVFYGIGTIVGAGIYVLVGEVAGAAGMSAPLAFVVAAILVLFSAFSYAELAARFPKSAGEAIYVQEGLGLTSLAIVVGLGIVSIGIISTATLVHGFVGYLQVFLPLPRPAVIVTLVLLLGLIVAWGIQQSAVIASLMTVVELFGLLLVLWVTRAAWGGLPARLPEMLPSFDATIVAGILLGAFIAFYAFVGFEDIVNVAEEAREPERNLPRAILTAWAVTTVLYLTVSTASVLVLAPADLKQSQAPLAAVYAQATGKEPLALTAIGLVSVLNGALIQIIMASRVLYGMARRGWLPQRLGDVHGLTHTPLLATAVITCAILVFALWLPLLSLAKLTSLITLSVFTLVNLSLWRLKARQPLGAGLTVPYWVPVTGFFVNLAFISYQIMLCL